MSFSISANTQAILLLTAPLIDGRTEPSADLLTPSEYRRVARFLSERQRQPDDLLDPDQNQASIELETLVEADRFNRLMARGFQLSQAVERWQARSIWVVGQTDEQYPKRIKERLRELAPAVIYGCGDATLLATAGLAVVGSREVDSWLVEYTEGIARLAAEANKTVISGGARGIDQAAMRGALEAGGKVVGVLADSLERAAMNRENRTLLMEGELVLISLYDPSAGFSVGNAMQRNKLIYALADAALAVNSDYEKGGTWAGAVEQLEKFHFVPIYIRTEGEIAKGLEALRRRGALPWPNPTTTEAFVEALAVPVNYDNDSSTEKQLSFSDAGEFVPREASPSGAAIDSTTTTEDLFATVRSLLEKVNTPKTDKEIAKELNVSKSQLKECLQRLVKEGVLERLTKPTRYRATVNSARLF